ncbi:MAG: hypothetical protein IKE43_03360 [Coriobacteriales bacterium]|nr:hypothetical protein [Coriobacteriales bacterium]
MNAQASQESYELQLFDDLDFQHLIHEYARRCMSWDEFLEQPLPRGVSPRCQCFRFQKQSLRGTRESLRLPVCLLPKSSLYNSGRCVLVI